MGYPEMTSYESVILRAGTITTAANLAATAGQWVGFAVLSPIMATRLKFIVTTAVTAGTTAPVVAVKRRPTLGSSSNAVVLTSMTIPNGAAVGTVYYRDIPYGSGTSNKYLNAGEELSLEVTTQATDGGTAAGAGFITVERENVVDQAANQSKMVALTA